MGFSDWLEVDVKEQSEGWREGSRPEQPKEENCHLDREEGMAAVLEGSQ